ncbi:MAG: cyclopropane-fatty-acyl-phospholipid synthase family protein [bacterium]
MNTDALLAKGLLPDALVRLGIRRLLKTRLRQEDKGNPKNQRAHLEALVENLKQSPIALHAQAANAQHYEVPSRFYELCLGKHLKYSSAYWPEGVDTLDAAEAAMLRLTCERARLEDGLQILELGCGWGSLSLWMAEHFPKSRITGVSNSRTQKAFIDSQIEKRKLQNLKILTADMNAFETEESFDRIVSVEMFEHMRNYELLLAKVARWLKNDGLLFAHLFTHREYAYAFEDRDASDWMSRYFFTGGMMPSDGLLFSFQKDLKIVDHWWLNGRHYKKTAEAWLRQMDSHASEILSLFRQTYGEKQARKWFHYWRVFFMACAELWGYRKGEEWGVSHYLFSKNSPKKTPLKS